MPAEHGIAHLKNWRTLAWHHGRLDLPDTFQPSPDSCRTNKSRTIASWWHFRQAGPHDQRLRPMPSTPRRY